MRLCLICLLLLILTPAEAAPSLAQRGFAVTRDVIWLIQPTEDAKIALFDGDGTWITSVGTEEPLQPNTIVAPVELLTDAGGNCYVLDQFGPSIVVLSPTGAVLRRFGERGFDKGQMRQPVDFGLDDHNILYVLDLGREVVLRFSTSGRFINEILLDPEQAKDLHWSKAIGVGTAGDFILAADATGVEGLLRHLRRFNADGELQSDLSLAKIEEDGEINDVTVLPNGKVLFADTQVAAGSGYSGAVYRFSKEGEYETRWFIADPRSGKHYTPVRVKAVGSALYVLTQTNLICRIDEGGVIERTWGAGEL